MNIVETRTRKVDHRVIFIEKLTDHLCKVLEIKAAGKLLMRSVLVSYFNNEKHQWIDDKTGEPILDRLINDSYELTAKTIINRLELDDIKVNRSYTDYSKLNDIIENIQEKYIKRE
jgi:hypothetical protein